MQLAGESCLAQGHSDAHSTQRRPGVCGYRGAVASLPRSVVLSAPPLGISGESIFLSVIALICGAHTSQVSEG